MHIPDAVDGHGVLLLPMADDHVKAFFGDMTKEKPKGGGSIKSVSTLSNYWSSLKFLHKENRTAMSPAMYEWSKDFSNGYKRTVARKKDEGVMKNVEGKVPVTFTIYTLLCSASLFICSFRSHFATFIHLFVILCWNLFARSISIAALRTTHMYWSNDMLVVDFALHKGDQTGDAIAPKHVAANPFNPAVCPILALGLHMFCWDYREKDANLLFLGSPYDVFSKWLPTALEKIETLGGDVTDYGTHSFRKGIASYCAGFLGGPAITAIFLRAGWSMGQIKDRYIFQTDGADQLAGRVACGLNFNDGANFAVLPPHFPTSAVLTKEQWMAIMPMYESFPVPFQGCLPYFLASLVYHWDWLNEKDAEGGYIVIRILLYTYSYYSLHL